MTGNHWTGEKLTITEIKEFNKEQAKQRDRAYWFAADAMRFFNTVIEKGTYHGIGGLYFVTRERYNAEHPWKWSVREVRDNGSIETVGRFNAIGSLAEARQIAKDMATLCAGIDKILAALGN